MSFDKTSEEYCGTKMATVIHRITSTKGINGKTVPTSPKSSKGDILWLEVRELLSIAYQKRIACMCARVYLYITRHVWKFYAAIYPYRVCVRHGKIAHNNEKKGRYWFSIARYADSNKLYISGRHFAFQLAYLLHARIVLSKFATFIDAAVARVSWSEYSYWASGPLSCPSLPPSHSPDWYRANVCKTPLQKLIIIVQALWC